MRTTTTRWALAFAIGVTMLSNPVLASWGAAGSREPDTFFDASGSRMFASPDVTPGSSVRKVYFDAFNTLAPTAFNPNFATLETRIAPIGQTRFHAILGVWKDCNRDGYIGSGDNALREYRTELLIDTGVCPASALAPSHNDGQWVVELHALAHPDPCGWGATVPQGCPRRNAADATTLDANGTFVWGDIGAPGEVGEGGECRILPIPAGTTSGTGRLLAFADCFAGHHGARLTNEALALADPENDLGLRFEDPHHPESSRSPLNAPLPVNAFGNPDNGKSGLLEQDSGERAFAIWKCAPGSSVSPENRTLQPSLDAPTGSYWDGLVDAQEGAAGDCDATSNNTLRAFYPLLAREAGEGVDPNHRTRNNFIFRYHASDRGSGIDPIDGGLGRHAADDLGIGALRAPRPLAPSTAMGPEWIADETYLTTPPLLRSDLTPDGRKYHTFYARLTEATISKHHLTLPDPRVAVYGSDACGANISPGARDKNGWSCDPTAWWPSGSAEFYSGTPLGQRVGAPYQLKDVDCVDGSVMKLVHLSATPISPEGACA